MRHRPLFVVITLIVISATQLAGQLATPQSAGNGPVVARVTLTNPIDRAGFLQLGLDLLELRRGDDLFILTSRGEVEELRAKGWAIGTDSEQTALFNQQMSLNTYRSGYRTVAVMPGVRLTSRPSTSIDRRSSLMVAGNASSGRLDPVFGDMP